VTTLAERVLVVICSLSGGEEGRRVHVPTLLAECNRVGIKTMTDVEFELYRAGVLAEVERRKLQKAKARS
jgi:hypothetical protein